MTTKTKTTTIELDPDKIEVGNRIRMDLGDINELASSIAKVGQIHPIQVTNGKGRPKLIAGYRRVKACMQIGVKVRAEVIEAAPKYLTLLRQIHENIKRKNFDKLEEGEACQRTKIEYEIENPETKHGGKRRGPDQVAKPATRFTLVAADELGCSERTVQELLELANLPKQYKQMVAKAKTTSERNKVANECLKRVRDDAKINRLREQAEEKRQVMLEEHGAPKPPALILHVGDNKKWLKGAELYELCLTDPPYERERNSIAHVARASINAKTHAWDKLDVGWVMRIAPVLTKGGHVLAFCPLEAIGTYEAAFEAAGLDYRQALVWVKTNPAPVHREVYASAVEAIVWATKPGGKPYRDPEAAKAGAESLNVFWGPGVTGSAKDRIHPTQKPEWLIRKLLRLHASADLQHRVIDPFAGGATTGVVCRQEKIACTMIECDEEMVAKARIRLAAV